ncbi:acyl carrier protein [Intestinibacillus massiliensis]|uniref:acyl carrier protein n=1 Tax=Intestinibacillus massiliensis TaxID=1871029 RepID=UPI000B3620E4|nr:acyl carrier protein [Intestinibacillus massiliensis]MCB6366425.1 acyl carrier protein [Intestinibacillus massiliensis]
MVFDKLCELLAEQFGVDPKTITMDTSFVEDLGADSLDLVELMMSLEEEFDVGTIDEETAMGIKTVSDAVRVIGGDAE